MNTQPPATEASDAIAQDFRDAMKRKYHYDPEQWGNGLASGRDADRLDGFRLAREVDTAATVGGPRCAVCEKPAVCANYCTDHSASDGFATPAAPAGGSVVHATPEMLRTGWQRECDDTDKIIAKLGIPLERARTEGGSLNVPRILNHIQETLDALGNATAFGAHLSDRIAAAQPSAKDGVRVGDGPDYPDGYDHEGFPGGTARMNATHQDDGQAHDASVWTLIALAEKAGGIKDSSDDETWWTLNTNAFYELESSLRRRNISAGWPEATTATGLVDCEVCRIFGDSNLLRKSATPINSVDDEMVVRALDTLAPQAVTNRYGYRKGYRVRDVLALDDYEATEVMRAALEAAIGREVGG